MNWRQRPERGPSVAARRISGAGTPWHPHRIAGKLGGSALNGDGSVVDPKGLF